MRKTFLAGKCQSDGEFEPELPDEVPEPSREEIEEIMNKMMKEDESQESQLEDITSDTMKPVMSKGGPKKKK